MKADRARDELLVTWLRLQAEGWSSRKIAQTYGIPDGNVRTIIKRVRAADQAAEGKPA